MNDDREAPQKAPEPPVEQERAADEEDTHLRSETDAAAWKNVPAMGEIHE